MEQPSQKNHSLNDEQMKGFSSVTQNGLMPPRKILGARVLLGSRRENMWQANSVAFQSRIFNSWLDIKMANCALDMEGCSLES